VVEHNYFEGCNGELEIISSKSCGNIFRFNTFVNCTGTLTLRECHRNSVYNNFFFGDHKSNAGAIRIIGEDNLVYNNYITGLAGTNYRTAITIVNGIPNSPLTGYFQVKRAVVAFNTLVDNANNFNIGVAPDSTATLPPLDCVIANNIIYGTKAPLVAFPTAPINMTWQGNIFYGAATGFAALPANNFVTDPMLTAEDENGVRHLTAVSPAVNAAIGTFDYVRIDMDGQLRDAQKDIGADEYSLQPVVLTPLKASDVGPRKTITAIDGKENSHPVDFELMQNYPNPFNPSTKIAFVLPEHCHVQLTIYDTSGKEALQVFRGELERGYHEFSVDGTGLPSGVYVYRLKTEQGILANKMILLK
jgi:poly(beta-D-mannuronate) lyase